MSRQSNINCGHNGPIQRYSLSQAPNLSATTALLSTLTSACPPHRREQLLLDPTRCYQFACVWGDSIGFFTRPEVYLNALGETLVVGSFSDTIGTITAVNVPIADFQGSFTSLVRTADAEHFDLPRHPTPAADLPGPPDPNSDAPLDLVEGTLGCLNFGDAADLPDRPVIAALPGFLPLGPGDTFPDPANLSDDMSYCDSVRLLEVWKRAIYYLKRHNRSCSVTSGGGLFHLPGLHHVDEPFSAFVIRPSIPADPGFLLPHSPMAHTLRHTISALSERVWLELGCDIDEVAALGPGASALSEEQIRAIVQPIVSSKARSTKEIEQTDTANDVARYYQLALASFPTSTSHADNVAEIPTLDPLFLSMLQKSQPSGAAKTLREMIATKVKV